MPRSPPKSASDTSFSPPAYYSDKPLLDLPTAFSTLTCLQRGLCPVSLRGFQSESHSLYYEVYGSPATAAAIAPHAGDDGVKDHVSPKKLKNKLVFIPGLNATYFCWDPQVRWFVPSLAGDEEEEYTVLVFDNRGVGNSGYPMGPYTTEAMAEDVICLLDYLGWTADRELNIVGMSLGGMIAQELAYRIPNRISSLLLAVTTPGGPWGGHIFGKFPWKKLCGYTKLAFSPGPVAKVPTILELLFTSNWLDSKAENDHKGRTNRQIQSKEFITRATIAKPQRFLGHISQAVAAFRHHVSPPRLAFISARIPKIIIVTGDEDHLVAPEESRRLWRGMTSNQDIDRKPESGQDLRVELVQWEGTGHGIHIQKEREFNELITRCVREGRNLNGIADLS